MPALLSRTTRAALAALLLAAGAAQAQDAPATKTAPGFTAVPPGAKVAIMPADLELYSISAGGLLEPRADWTDQARKNLSTALLARRGQLAAQIVQVTREQADEVEDVVALHRAVADAISLHHLGALKLLTKNHELDWSLGDAVRPLAQKTGADYALFTYLRDSYASNERKITMIGMALMGGFLVGGEQDGYASLVDLHTGRVVWFSGVARAWGDLRDGGSAQETVDALLKGLPGVSDGRTNP